MPRELHRSGLPLVAASAGINAGAVVAQAAGGDYQAIALATVGARPLGIALATAASIGHALTVMDEGNTVTVTAAASVGPGAEVGVVGATTSIGLVAGASGVVKYSVGQTLSGGAAGEDISVYVNPRQLSGLV